MKKFTIVLSLAILFASPIAVSTVQAGELDVLLEKLVDKGVLSPLESQIIKDETKQLVAEEIADQRHPTLPSWVQTLKLKGDIRVRYQKDWNQSDAYAKHRGRVRMRLGLLGAVDRVNFGIGIATGGADPRSTNQTFADTFDTGDLRLDYAYLQYSPKTWFLLDQIDKVDLVLGKFPRKEWLWQPTDLLWDGDINPAGFSMHAEQTTPIDNVDVFANAGIWFADERDHDRDPDGQFIKVLQVGANWVEEVFDAKAAASMYHFNRFKGNCSPWSQGTNSGITAVDDASCTGALTYDYDSFGFESQVGATQLFGGLPFGIDEYLSVFAQFIHNIDDTLTDNESGWAFGTAFGHKKVKNPGSWQVKYIKAVLGRDAWLDALPDSDRYGGKTGVKSHEVVVSYALRKNVILSLDYYQSNYYGSWKAHSTDHIVQGDVLIKF